MKNHKILLDSNVLVYAIDADSKKGDIARNFILSEIDRICTSSQNILETLRVVTHPNRKNAMSINQASEALNRIIDATEVISPIKDSYILAIELLKGNQLTGNQVFDAYLAATMLQHNIFSIATENGKHFECYGLKIINPFLH